MPRYPDKNSTFGTTLVSILATWVVSSLAFAPIVVLPLVVDQPPSGPHVRILPIPPGADWTS